jgi:hypothetical protein
MMLSIFCKVAIGCLVSLSLASALGCSVQEGSFRVTQRKTAYLRDRKGVIDVLYGVNSNRSEENLRLLTIIVCDPSQSFDDAVRVGEDGRTVSSINLSLNNNGATSFHYGAGWNRVSDVVVINSNSYDREKGSIFLITALSATEIKVYQIEDHEADLSESSLDSILDVIANRISHEKSIPDNIRDFFTNL